MRVATSRSEEDAALAVQNLQSHGYKKLIKKNPKPSHTEFQVISHEYYNDNTAIKEDNDDDDDNRTNKKEQEDGKRPSCNPNNKPDSNLNNNPFRAVTRISLIPHTGRTHQLRVHCASIGHPIVSDPAYGIYGEANPCGGLLQEEKEGSFNNIGATIENQLELNKLRPLPDYPMCLHATKLSLKHPITKELMTWEVPPEF